MPSRTTIAVGLFPILITAVLAQKATQNSAAADAGQPQPMGWTAAQDHQNWNARSQEVMSLLRITGQFRPREQSFQSTASQSATSQSTASGNARVPADRPAPRIDPNSITAHAQLLEKAKQGRIDVYFEGDSITRRWGATDYPQLLANWRENFFGWNAADFGWGADRIENILWRLDNGELDGVNPKVIVLLAGTNNIGTAVPSGGETAMIEDVTRGIKAVLQVLQTKAPHATIILTGIFPRNDAMNALPVIIGINRNLAGLADGAKIRYLDINDKLADAGGRLFDGMMNADKLHPALKGYQVWADALKPLFTGLLGAPAKQDYAPPPTGDPSARR
jgi:lysophospholipase L1-like esterase